MKLLNDHRTFKALAVCWMAIIFGLSSLQDLPGPSLFYAQDKLAHVLVFGVLGFFFSRSFRPRDENLSFTRVLLVTLMVAVYGGFDEAHQMFVPGREASLGDLAADTVGGFLAGIFFWKR
ncbi:MAG: VanZ family protein [Deltaproteobacteria bacterium]|nr:VanZ family protein [Deltaproteobacteria bacterium]MBW2118412.1 VanZ family protein [Deltaproteobacteria bacterium]